jgi:transcriptional regulator with XRE-family HTH domain
MINFVSNIHRMTIGEKIKQLLNNKGSQQKIVATDVSLDPSNYNKVENGKPALSVEVLQKLSVILGVTVDELPNPDNKQKPTPVTIEDKTVSEKIRRVEQLEEEDKNVIYKMLDTMLTKKKFQDFFQ